MSYLTSGYIKQILTGEKFLLELSKVRWVEQGPNWKELSARVIWEVVKQNNEMLKYFPDYGINKYP